MINYYDVVAHNPGRITVRRSIPKFQKQLGPKLVKHIKGIKIICYIDFHGAAKNMWTAYKPALNEHDHSGYTNQCSSLSDLFGKMKEKGFIN